jgi:hypothetical protein
MRFANWCWRCQAWWRRGEEAQSTGPLGGVRSLLNYRTANDAVGKPRDPLRGTLFADPQTSCRLIMEWHVLQ